MVLVQYSTFEIDKCEVEFYKTSDNQFCAGYIYIYWYALLYYFYSSFHRSLSRCRIFHLRVQSQICQNHHVKTQIFKTFLLMYYNPMYQNSYTLCLQTPNCNRIRTKKLSLLIVRSHPLLIHILHIHSTRLSLQSIFSWICTQQNLCKCR